VSVERETMVMPGRKQTPNLGTLGLPALLDVACDPQATPERLAEARRLLHDACGAYAEPLLRTAAQAAAARRELIDARQALARLRDGPRLRGIVTDVYDGRLRVLIGGAERVLPRPDGEPVGIGRTVLTDAEGRAVLAVGDYAIGGQAYVFCERLEGRCALVRPLRDGAADDARQLALVAEAVDLDRLAPGDRVLGYTLDAGGNVLLLTRRLGGLRRTAPDDVGAGPAVRLEDLVGLEDVVERTELLFLEAADPAYAAILAQVRRALAGVVFQGRPGTGKTDLARYYVGAVRRRGGRAIYRTAPFYLVKWVGEGAAHLRADFAELEASFRETGVRPLLVIDELEAIALDRGHAAALTAGHLDVLDELLGLLGRTEVRVIGISNVAHRVLDAALTRDGRLALVRFPATVAPEQAAILVARCLAGVPLAAESGAVGEPDAPVARAFGETVSDLVFARTGPLAELLRVQLTDGRVLGFGARDLATPAALADGVVRTTLAQRVRRDLRAGRPAPAPLTLDEMRAATVAHFVRLAAAITRDNVRAALPDRIPEDQMVTKVEPVLAPAGT
jgi:hypothetical protein